VGGVRHLTDPYHNTIKSYAYEPFGRILQEIGRAPNDFTFPATYLSLHSGRALLLSPQRAYDPRSARFLCRAILEGTDETNAYPFAVNRPTSVPDPTGLPRPDIGQARDLATQYGLSEKGARELHDVLQGLKARGGEVGWAEMEKHAQAIAQRSGDYLKGESWKVRGRRPSRPGKGFTGLVGGVLAFLLMLEGTAEAGEMPPPTPEQEAEWEREAAEWQRQRALTEQWLNECIGCVCHKTVRVFRYRHSATTVVMLSGSGRVEETRRFQRMPRKDCEPRALGLRPWSTDLEIATVERRGPLWVEELTVTEWKCMDED
jgi:RHS repeat-associated protein